MRGLVMGVIGIVVLGTLTISYSTPWTSTSANLQLTGQSVLGYSSVVFSNGNYTYVGVGSAIVALDTSNPSHPVETGRAFVPNCFDGKAGFGGDRLYIPRDVYGLGVFDVSQPDIPVHMDTYFRPDPSNPKSGHTAGGVEVVGGYVFWANNNYEGKGLTILEPDVSPPYLKEVGEYKVNDLSLDVALGVHVQGNVAYLCTRSTGVHVLDVHDKTAPSVIVRVTTGYAIDMIVSGQYGFVADGLYGLKIIDLTTYQVTSYAPPGSSPTTLFYRSLVLLGKYLYVAGALRGIDILDISTPTSPVLLKNIPKENAAAYPVQLSLSGNYLYATYLLGGLNVYSLSDPGNPQLVSNDDSIEIARDVAVLNGYAYLAYGDQGLAVVNVGNPAAPSREALYDINYGGNTTEAVFALSDPDRLYVADGKEGLKIFQVSSNPLEDPPELLWTYDLPVDVRDVQVVDEGTQRIAYIADYDHYSGGLWIVDVTRAGEPGFQPSSIRYLHGIGYPTRLFKHGDWVYTASNGPAIGCSSYNGLRVINLKEAPLKVKTWLQSGYNNISDVDAADINSHTYAFATTNGGPSSIPGVLPPPPSLLHILRNDNGTLTEVSTTKFQGSYFGDFLAAVEVAGEKAYVNHNNTGIYVYDVCTPASPVQQAYYRLTCNNSAYEIHLFGNYIYDAHGDSGLYIYRFLP